MQMPKSSSAKPATGRTLRSTANHAADTANKTEEPKEVAATSNDEPAASSSSNNNQRNGKRKAESPSTTNPKKKATAPAMAMSAADANYIRSAVKDMTADLGRIQEQQTQVVAMMQSLTEQIAALEANTIRELGRTREHFRESILLLVNCLQQLQADQRRR